jgi:DNA-binding transcriptional LysR family regulator
MDFRHLGYFVAIAEKQSFTEAAKVLHISQPALSAQIQDLEQELGVMLFNRQRRHISLTTAGEMFLKEAKAILFQAERAVNQTRRANQGDVGELRVGFLYVAVQHFLPALLKQFHQQMPDVVVHIAHMPNTQQLQAVEEGTLDVGFVRAFQPKAFPHVNVKTLFHDRPMVAVPLDHPLTHLEAVTLEDVRRFPLIPYARLESPALFQTWQQVLGPTVTLTHHAIKEPYMLDTTLLLVESGAGITIVPGCTQYYRPSKRVAFLPLLMDNAIITSLSAQGAIPALVPSTVYDLLLITQKNTAKNPMVEAFLKLMDRFDQYMPDKNHGFSVFSA